MGQDDGGHVPGQSDVGQLVLLAQQGDENAYRRLFEHYAGALRGFVIRRVPPALRRKISVADVLQETSWAAWKAIDRFEDRGDGAFLAWVTKIAERKVQDVLRHHAAKRRAAHLEVGSDRRPATREVAALDATPSQHAMGHELAERLREGLTQLTSLQRLVIYMVRVEGAPCVSVGVVRLWGSRGAPAKAKPW